MIRELTPQEVVYNVDFVNTKNKDQENYILEYNEIYKSVETALSINKEGYNMYVVDEFSKEKLESLMKYVDKLFKSKEKPKDICYVTSEDSKSPKALILDNGSSKEFRDSVERLKNIYFDKVFNFYHSSSNEEKEDILDDVQTKRSSFIGNLVEMAKEEGFELKATSTGFAFIPLKEEGEAMTEKEYDDLQEIFKEDIMSKAEKLKISAEDVLEKLKDIELTSINKLKYIYTQYLQNEMEDIKKELNKEFENQNNILNYLSKMCKNIEKDITEIYSMNYDEDEEKIGLIIEKYGVNVLVDNKGVDHPKVIFEEDPSINNLIGTIDYENHNGTYSTDLSLINAGSILNANEGCLIIRVASLIDNPGSYYQLRKTLMSGKLSYDYNRGYLEFIALNGLKPEPININVKVILIGDYNSFDLLYHYDEDFSKIFRIKAEYNPYIDINDNVKSSLVNIINDICKYNNILPLSNGAINTIGKYLSRKASSRNKIFIDDFILDKVLILSNNIAEKENLKEITEKETNNIIYSEELIEKEIMDSFKDGKTMINVNSSIIGSINGLSVINTGYSSFGNPTRITCICNKGNGRIIDVQRESNLSGNIHIKSINILRGVLNRVINPYKSIPVDFHLSFEQIYGMLDGDSASVAEIICMISALSKIPIKQNIAVTGSLNQFGEVQPIGGVNEKIEGFFKVCKRIDTEKGKGVLIPYSNKDELVLNNKVEEAIKNGEFKIYVMKDLNDAINTLLCYGNMTMEDLLIRIQNELTLYEDK